MVVVYCLTCFFFINLSPNNIYKKAIIKDNIEILDEINSELNSILTPRKTSKNIIGIKTKVRIHLIPIDNIKEIKEARKIEPTNSFIFPKQ